MPSQKILVIDDSATIRKLVDTHLSPVGYDVFLAANAEDGLAMAEEIRPDLILLDHQLPGTTGYEVCRQLVAADSLRSIPVVVSSTLRKRAYAEYTDLDNVVDMLPKPYTEELLRTTVANALETAAMVVASQSAGTAVPEVIHNIGDAELGGSFSLFSLREVIDFLNNGAKRGCLEVESHRQRFAIYLDRGHIQGVSAAGLSEPQIESILGSLPTPLANLAPLLRMTLGGRGCAEVDGFIQLLDRKVLDPRLMSRLLQYQSAMLVRLAFASPLKAFRFESARKPSDLFQKLPLDTSLLALLVEGAVQAPPEDVDAIDEDSVLVRRAIRGQNLDRAGLSARHMKILGLLAEPRTVAQMAAQLAWPLDEVRCVLRGFIDAELIQIDDAPQGEILVCVADAGATQQIRGKLGTTLERRSVRVVHDRLTAQLALRRQSPEYLLFDADQEDVVAMIRHLKESGAAVDPDRCVAISARGDSEDLCESLRPQLGFAPVASLPAWFTAQSVAELLRAPRQRRSGSPTAPAAPTTAPAAPSLTPTSVPGIALAPSRPETTDEIPAS